jgi:hypothetical protein
MGQKIWGVLADYEGRWVAVDKAGAVVADSETLPGVMNAVGDAAYRVTYVFAAAGPDGESVKECLTF